MEQRTQANVEREAVKAYLQQYHTAKDQRRILQARHSELKRELEAPTPGSRYMSMPTSKPAPNHDGAVSVVFRIAEVEERIENQRQAMEKAIMRIMDLIDLLPASSFERQVVELRHIDCKGWERISREVHMSRSRCIDYYNAALDTIALNRRAQKVVREYEQAKAKRQAEKKIAAE
jgi:hypothetical protein